MRVVDVPALMAMMVERIWARASEGKGIVENITLDKADAIAFANGAVQTYLAAEVKCNELNAADEEKRIVTLDTAR